MVTEVASSSCELWRLGRRAARTRHSALRPPSHPAAGPIHRTRTLVQRTQSGRAILRANVDRLQATASHARPMSRLVKCPVSLPGDARRCSGADWEVKESIQSRHRPELHPDP